MVCRLSVLFYVPSSLANNPLGSLFKYSIIFQSVFFPEDVQGACQRGQHSPLSPGNKPSRGYLSGAGRIGEVCGLCIRKLAGGFPEMLAGG